MHHTFRFLKQLSLATPLNDTLRRREPVLRVLFNVTFVLLACSTLALCAAYVSNYDRLVLHRLAAVIAALLTVAVLRILLYARHYFVSGYGLLGIYGLLATVMAIKWGVDLPVSLLLYSAIIVLSGMILGARQALFTLLGSVVVTFIVQLATVQGQLHPNLYWQHQSPFLSDLIGYYLVFMLLGVSSWLFNRQTDRALHRALEAEAALQREKDSLERKVEERTRALQSAQFEKMQQVYRFAQLGQFSTSVLHDIGNHMATLSIDIEGIGESDTSTSLQRRIKRRIGYIDDMVHRAYSDIGGGKQVRRFDVIREIHEITKIVQYDASMARVRLHEPTKPAKPLTLYGDAARFRQLIINLTTNAVAAYPPADATAADNRDVWVSAEAAADNSIIVTVQDNGKGIPHDIQSKIFDPFYSTKHTGTGIGLYIVKQVAEEHFNGTVHLTSRPGETIFKITLHAATPQADKS